MGQSHKPDMQELWSTSHLCGGNAAWLDALYEVYLRSPKDVEPHWKEYFDALPRVTTNGAMEVPHAEIREHFKSIVKHSRGGIHASTPSSDIVHQENQVHVLQLINAYRFRGHQQARTNPLESDAENTVPELTLGYHQLSENDYATVFETGSLAGPETATLKEIHEIVSQSYCNTIGTEYMHITETDEKRWIQERLELTRGATNLTHDEKKYLLQQLTEAEGLEKYLHTKYVGQKRFSLEGGESLIPMLDFLVQHGGKQGVKEIVLGMAHRGRLNVLINIMGKTPEELFQEFEGTKDIQELTGDVKYHLGFSSSMITPGGAVHLALAFNPSHLEIVAPVVEGSVRARQWRRNDREGNQVIPVQIHGDAAFSGQGVVMETLQMSQSRGYSTRGTIHIIINNQIGFTTSMNQDARSTNYCTDIAKMVDAPIFHVNGDDPEAVLKVTEIAIDYRMAFKKDVVIDMVCYRRHGHNEADEPTATQPMMYKRIRALPTTRTLYANELVAENVLTVEDTVKIEKQYRKDLEAGKCVVPNMLKEKDNDAVYGLDWKPYVSGTLKDNPDTGVPLEKIRELNEMLEDIPDGFETQPRVTKVLENRHKMCAGALPIDWGYAETLAYATLVDEKYSIRLSGQDSGRGTFFHRHCVLHNQVDGTAFVPLRNIGDEKINFLVIDSLLSELAVLAFEYGFSTADPTTLAIWEAQFGDFANGAQVVIDQFITSGEHKWGRSSGLTMLLPHGFEGQGAEHSSARLERYLQSCSENNIQVCVPTTPAQIFHVLRRQMVRNCRKPLITMTPKSLLRHKLCVSKLDDLTQGSYKTVLAEPSSKNHENVRRVILCCGKVYYDLLEYKNEHGIDNVAIVRLEQLYPFPGEVLMDVLQCYTENIELVWCQEEPKNQGAWDYCKPRLRAALGHTSNVKYIGREPSSAPAVGSAKLFAIQQNELVTKAMLVHAEK